MEKGFFKLMNNSNFGYNSQNNLNNWKFAPIFHEFKEITCVGRYFNFFDPRILQFATTDLIKQDMGEKYNKNLIKLDKEDKFYTVKLSSLNAKRLSNLEAPKNFEKKKGTNKKRLNLVDFSERKSGSFKK